MATKISIRSALFITLNPSSFAKTSLFKINHIQPDWGRESGLASQLQASEFVVSTKDPSRTHTAGVFFTRSRVRVREAATPDSPRNLKAKQMAIRIAQHCAPCAMFKLHRAR